MKQLLLTATTALFTVSMACAQPANLFSIYDSIDINKLNYKCLVYGSVGGFLPQSRNWTPTQSDKTILWSNPWMSGYDASNVLHVSSQTYNQERMFRFLDSATMRWETRYSSNYWPGPLSGSGYQDYTTSEKWAKIWKVSANDIQEFMNLASPNTGNVPQAILSWPAKGNTYAKGNGGAPLVINEDMAPFVDLNGNGTYEPLQGEYPDIKGDQALWWVFSDRGFSDSEQCANPVGVEVRQMVYGYNRGDLLDNAIYFDYTLINRSGNNYHDFRMAQWDDADLGWYYDDFIGFDSSRRLGILYNGTNDDGAGGGHTIFSYGDNPPMFGLTMIVMPGDAGTSYKPAGSFLYYNNDNSFIGSPDRDIEYDNYMRARWRNGEHIRNDFQGAGIQTTGYGAGSDCNYLYPGDPANSAEWSECASNNLPGDRRFILSGNDFTFPSGGRQHIVMAMMRRDSAGGCPATSFDKIRELNDTVWAAYNKPPQQLYERKVCCGGTEKISAWPNPATDRYYINAEESASITIYSSMGMTVKIPVAYNGMRYELDISALPRGLYNVVCSGKSKTSLKFLKQ